MLHCVAKRVQIKLCALLVAMQRKQNIVNTAKTAIRFRRQSSTIDQSCDLLLQQSLRQYADYNCCFPVVICF